MTDRRFSDRDGFAAWASRWALRRAAPRLTVAALLTVAVLLGTRAVARDACTGDCDGNSRVTVNELVTGVKIAVGDATPGSCPSFVCRPGAVQVDCLMKGVKHALGGCPPAGAVWVSYVLCRQCSPCDLTINELIALANGTLGIPELPPEILPPDIQVFDTAIDIPQIVCAACGCPVGGSPIVSISVSEADAARLREIGWIDG